MVSAWRSGCRRVPDGAGLRRREGAGRVSDSFVLAHRSWCGGAGKRVAERLRHAASEVYAASFTGMAERAHLLDRGITIDTFVEDLVGVINARSSPMWFSWDTALGVRDFRDRRSDSRTDRAGRASRCGCARWRDARRLGLSSAEAEAGTGAAEPATDGLAVPVATLPTARRVGAL